MKKYIILIVALAFWGCSSESVEPTRFESGVNSSSDLGAGVGTGTGGSLARFTIANDHLYIATAKTLYTFSLSDAAKPELKSELALNTFAETIFQMGGNLFLGTQNGVLIYSLGNPERPEYLSIYEHIVSCDPVVARGNVAYSTLRTESSCWRGVNRLDIIDISTITSPFQTGSVNMTNPKGLGLSGNFLYVCDANELVRFDVSDPYSPASQTTVKTLEGCYDMIPVDDRMIVATTEGIYQFKVKADGDLELLSNIALD